MVRRRGGRFAVAGDKVPSRSVLVLRTVARHGPIEVYHTQETFGAAQFMRRSEWYERVDEDAGEAE